MIPVPSDVRVWIATGHTDMRRGMNGLALQVQQVMKRAGSVCLNSFALKISGFLPGFLGWRFWGATQGGRSPTGVARQKLGEVHAAALSGG